MGNKRTELKDILWRTQDEELLKIINSFGVTGEKPEGSDIVDYPVFIHYAKDIAMRKGFRKRFTKDIYPGSIIKTLEGDMKVRSISTYKSGTSMTLVSTDGKVKTVRWDGSERRFWVYPTNKDRR